MVYPDGRVAVGGAWLCREGDCLVVRNPGGTGRWLVVRTWVVEADTASEARAAAASERGWPLTETVTSLATEPPAAMPVSRPGRPARSTDFLPAAHHVHPRGRRPRAGRAVRVTANRRRRRRRRDRERLPSRAPVRDLRLPAAGLHRLEGHQRRRPLPGGHPVTAGPAAGGG
jgi:hypothetical protein